MNDAKSLPHGLRDLVDLIGMPACLKLSARYGGRRLSIPMAIRRDHPLALAIGYEASRHLVDTWGGDRLEVPKAESILRARRNKKIHDLKSRLSVPQIAEQFGLTERQVYNILSTSL